MSVTVYSDTVASGGDTGSAVTLERNDAIEAIYHINTTAGTATIAVEGSLDAGATWFVIKGAMTADEAFLGALAPRL